MRRHEAPAVGDAVVRMLRGLVERAAAGDTEAVEQLARIERLAPVATALAGRLAHDEAGYSYTVLGGVLGTSRQAARQRAATLRPLAGDAHLLAPGHRRRGCGECAAAGECASGGPG